MKVLSKSKNREIIYRNGKPTAVILDIADYLNLIERLDDIQDVKLLKKIRQKPLKFRKLSDFLNECNPPV
jgi:hypothetical protein